MTQAVLLSKKDELLDLTEWNNWHWQLRNRIQDKETLKQYINLTSNEERAIDYSGMRFKMAITPYFASLMDKDDPSCPIRRQAIPSMKEFIVSDKDMDDPCGEEKDEVTPGLVHRYPDRVLFLVTDTCAMYCRHCTRRRMVATKEGVLAEDKISSALDYIRSHSEIRDVLLSGGDVLTLSDNRLEQLLTELRSIPHIEMLRIGTRVPVTLPQRITKDLVNMLKKFHPLYLSIHFNHPKEISEDVKLACSMLADAGIPLGSQTVLLKGINDNPKTMTALCQELLRIRVRPYYLYQCDLAKGTEGFRTSVDSGLRIIQAMRGHTTGYAIPTYVIDAPGGGGKVPVSADNIVTRSDGGVYIKNYRDEIYFYPERN